jgi:hypothetical protein
MLKKTLAQELRQRQYFLGQVPQAMVDRLGDDAMIETYITCYSCDTKLVDEQQLELAIQQAVDSEDFLNICDQLADHYTH